MGARRSIDLKRSVELEVLEPPCLLLGLGPFDCLPEVAAKLGLNPRHLLQRDKEVWCRVAGAQRVTEKVKNAASLLVRGLALCQFYRQPGVERKCLWV